MAVSAESRKKLRERAVLDEARRVSSIFPSGDLVSYEKRSFPDFLLHADAGTIGIEVTELCRKEPKDEHGKLSKVLNRAKANYSRLANSCPIDVSAAFAPDTKNIRLRQLTNGLVNFVYAKRNEKGAYNGNDCELPEGYCYIAISSAQDSIGDWRTFESGDTTLATRELLDSCMEKKNLRLPDYRVAAREIWLLIFNDPFSAAGEVYANPDYLAKWRLAFDFEKVLLFSRESIGSGQVIELQRRCFDVA